MIEAMLPCSAAVVVDCQTDNKLRTLNEARALIKDHDGTITPTTYLFTKTGRIVFQAKDGINAETALEAVLNFNLMDAFDDEDGRIVMLTEPNETSAVIGELDSQHGLQLESSDIVWEPNQDTIVSVGEGTELRSLGNFVDEIQELTGFQAIYMNVAQGRISDASWADFRQKIAG